MKWVALLLLLIILPVPSALADDSAEVSVIAVPYYGWGIADFTAVIITDTQVDLTWTNGEDVTNVMVRAQYSTMPMSRTEGYLAYEGAGESASDTSMDFDTNPGIIYYRIWAYKDGAWMDGEVNSASLEGLIMALLAIFLVCGIISYLSFANSFPLLKLAAGASWIGAFIYFKDNAPTQIVEGSAAHTVILLVLVVMAIAIPLAGLGRDIQRSRDMQDSYKTRNMFNDFKWRFGRDKDEIEGLPRQEAETAEDYRAKLRRALRRD